MSTKKDAAPVAETAAPAAVKKAPVKIVRTNNDSGEAMALRRAARRKSITGEK